MKDVQLFFKWCWRWTKLPLRPANGVQVSDRANFPGAKSATKHRSTTDRERMTTILKKNAKVGPTDCGVGGPSPHGKEVNGWLSNAGWRECAQGRFPPSSLWHGQHSPVFSREGPVRDRTWRSQLDLGNLDPTQITLSLSDTICSSGVATRWNSRRFLYCKQCISANTSIRITLKFVPTMIVSPGFNCSCLNQWP